MPLTISFAQAQHSDLTFLLALRKQTMGQHLIDAGIAMSDEQHIVRIKEFFLDSNIIYGNNEPIGLIKLGLFTDRIHIRQFQMLNQYQNKGIGKQVLLLIQQKASKKNLKITLNVLLKNPAKALYERCGFLIEGENALEYQMYWQEKQLNS